QDPTLYPEGLVTGYFGTLTEQAVKNFQCRYNIVCGGSPLETGWGQVGPQTRERLWEIYP
ncbi:MAG: peptidoglycan-binding domain-containing protein, partial [Candidatus Paceibacteria bacterium]